MFHVVTPSSGCLDYERLVPNPTEQSSAEEIRKRYGRIAAHGRPFDTLVFHASRCIEAKNSETTACAAGPDTEGRSFLPWCLMRCAEAAALLSIGTVRVDCDRETWIMLRPSLELVRTVTGRRLIKGHRHQTPFFRSRSEHLPRNDFFPLAN